jgi:hypothetical protein
VPIIKNKIHYNNKIADHDINPERINKLRLVIVNRTHDRPRLHSALRLATIRVNRGVQEVHPAVPKMLARIPKLRRGVHNGQRLYQRQPCVKNVRPAQTP